MVKKSLPYLLCATAITTPLSAQTYGGYNVPSDILSPYYTPITPIYNTSGASNVVIDSTVTPMPVTPLTNIPIPSTTNRIVTNGPFNGSANPYCTTIPYGGTCTENKFRTIIDFSHMLPDDPIRNARAPGTSHLHCFFGAGSTNAYSTYKTLRNHGLNSTAAGTDINATAYWYPCIVALNPYSDGKNYAIKADSFTVYYTENPATNGTGDGAKAFVPMGLRYVFGFDMDSSTAATQYPWLQSVIDAANIAQGSGSWGATRYSLTDPSGHYQTQASYNCVGATGGSKYVIKNADGSDPWNGTCAAGGGTGNNGDFYVLIDGPSCYDGTNLWSPGGYKHLIPGIWDKKDSKFVCPTNFYRLPTLHIEFHFTQGGWTDRQRWDLTSDISYRTAHGLTQATLPPGTTFHTDWLGGWDNVQMRKWEINCLAVEHNLTGHQCDSSQISSTEYLKGGISNESGAGGRSPQVDSNSVPHTLQTDPGWMLIPPSWSGNLTNMHMHT